MADILEESESQPKFLKLLTKSNSLLSVLQIQVEHDLGNGDAPTQNNIAKSAVVATSNGVVALGLKDNSYHSCFIPSFLRISNEELAKQYDKARFEEKEGDVIKAFQLLDPNIEKVETFSLVEPTLYLTRKQEKRLPISLFGDAINRIAAITLTMINSNHGILLIDEVENGLHYTSQVDFWKTLFRLSQKLNTQVFATTHSLEMIRAFAELGNDGDYQDQGTYFELTRDPRNNQIVSIQRDFELLQYDLKHNQPIRGEI